MFTAQRETIWRVVFPSNNVGMDEEFRIAAAPIYGSGYDASGGSLSNAELHKEITGRTSLEVPPEHVFHCKLLQRVSGRLLGSMD